MRQLITAATIAAALWATSKAETIPSPQQAQNEIHQARATLAKFGIENGKPLDWAAYINGRIDKLPKSGSGARAGLIELSPGIYPVGASIKLDRHVQLVGKAPTRQHPGGAASLLAVNPDGGKFDGEFVLSRRLHTKGKRYSDFSTGVRDLHVRALPGVGGIEHLSSQQGSFFENVVVRGFPGATGLKILGGDTTTYSRIYLDAKTGDRTWKDLESGDWRDRVKSSGTIGIDITGRPSSLTFQNITTHQCEIGLRIHDADALTFTGYENETTLIPVQITGNVQATTFRGCRFNHSDIVLDLSKLKEGDIPGFRIAMEGSLKDHRRGWILLPDDRRVPVAKQFDFVVENYKRELFVTDLRAERARAFLKKRAELEAQSPEDE